MQSNPFITKYLYKLASKYRENERSSIGPNLATELVAEFCKNDDDDDEGRRDLSPLVNKTCPEDLLVLAPESFYPIPWPEWKSLFTTDASPSDRTLRRIESRRTVHFWNELSSSFAASAMAEDAPFFQLAKRNCPMVFVREFMKPDQPKPLSGDAIAMMMKWMPAGDKGLTINERGGLDVAQ